MTYRGHLLVLIAAVLWSTSGFFAKAPWFEGWPEESRGLMLAFWRSAFAALLLVPMIRRPCFRLAMIPMVVCFAAMVASFMSAMVYGPAANAIWLQYLAPAWVLIIGSVIGKETVTAADVRMIICCVAAVLLILGFEFSKGGNLFATAMGILSGVTFAGVVLSMRSLRDVDPAWLITLNHSCTALLLLPLVVQVEGSVSTGSYLALAMFGIFQMSVPYVLFARGLRTVTSPEASVISLVEPILVPLWVFIAWSPYLRSASCVDDCWRSDHLRCLAAAIRSSNTQREFRDAEKKDKHSARIRPTLSRSPAAAIIVSRRSTVTRKLRDES